MFASGANYNKLKTNLRLSINRLKLLEKKKTELALKSRKEIADYISMGKVERAKIRVEHIVREDYLVEAMEMLEMFCDLLLARFGLIQQMKNIDDGLAEAISSIIWVAPRLQADVQELKVVADQFAAKYGKPYAIACRENAVGTVSEKLMHKLSVQAPPKLTVEKYLIEIAKYYNVEYEPDPQVLSADETYASDALIDLAPAPPLPDKNDFGFNEPGGSSAPPAQQQYVPFNYPTGGNPQGGACASVPPYPFPQGGSSVSSAGGLTYPPPSGSHPNQPPPNNSNKNNNNFNIPPEESNNFDDGPPPAYFPPDLGKPPSKSNEGSSQNQQTTSISRSSSVEDNNATGKLDLPELPGVPSESPAHRLSPDDDDDDQKKENNDEEIDFEDLTRRFEALKKRK